MDLVEKDRFEWDDEVLGLGLRDRGRSRSWVVQTRVDGRTVRRSLGAEKDLSLANARHAAAAVMAALHASKDAEEAAKSMTLGEFAETWAKDCAGQWKPRTLKSHLSDLRRLITPHLGERPVTALTRVEIREWHKDLACAEASANRAVAVLSGILRHAELKGLRPGGSNPCLGIRRKTSGFKALVLGPTGYSKLGKVLARRETKEHILVSLLRFLILTGCRRSEALLLQWDWIDANRAALPDAKAGPKSIWLPSRVREMLAQLPATCPRVFAIGGKPVSTQALSNFWASVRAEAKLGEIRIHDLRHSFATSGIGAGESLVVMSGLLGHSDLSTTNGYLHLSEGVLKEAAASVGAYLASALAGKKPPKLILASVVDQGSNPKTASPKRRPPLKHPPIPEALIKTFEQGRKTLPTFCQNRALDEGHFRRCLIIWRKQNGVGVGK